MQVLNSLLSIIPAFIFSLGVIIFVHEAGHLLMARAFNIRVLAFSLGFGKRLWGFQRGETEYRVSLVPLGGYVKLGGEFADEASDDPRDFVNRPRWQRVLVYLAGPAMNFLLAWVLIAIVFMVGISVPPRNLPPVVGTVLEDSAAARAGVQIGDRVLAIDGREVDEWQDVQMAVLTAPERPLTLTLERDGERREATITPELVPRYEYGEAGFFGPGKLMVSGVLKGEPAEAAGFQPDDEILTIAGRPVATSDDFISEVQQRPGEEVVVEVRRDGRIEELTVTPSGEPGAATVGVQIGYSFFQRYPPVAAMIESYHYNLNFIKKTLEVLGKLFTREVKAKSALAGPLEIAKMTGSEAQRGFEYLLHLMAFISVSIAIVNLLPVPILDGGQTLILLIESVLRRDLSLALKERMAQVGVILIFALMLTVIFFDIQKLF